MSNCKSCRIMSTKQLFFDDDIIDIENYLFNNDTQKPTPVNLSHDANKLIKEIDIAFTNKNMEAFCGKMVELFENRKLIIPKEFYQIIIETYFVELISNEVKPNLKYNISGLEPIINIIWEFAITNDRWDSYKYFHRWYEHYGYYDKAIKVLNKYIDHLVQTQTNYAIELNNMAYDYYLKKEWETAILLFKKAMDLSSESHQGINYLNFLLNQWLSKIEIIQAQDAELVKLEEEINSFEIKNGNLENCILITHGDYWHKRKPYILKAKIEEKKSNFRKSIFYVEKSIETIKNFSDFFLEKDSKYKVYLESQV